MLNVMNQNLNLRVSVLSVVVTAMTVRIFVARVVGYLIMLYLVTRGAYDEFEILGCFTDKEKAQKYAEYYAVAIGRNHYEQIRAGKMKVLDSDRKTYVVWNSNLEGWVNVHK